MLAIPETKDRMMVDHYMVTIPDWENGTAGMTFEQEYIYRKLCEFIYALDDNLKDDDRANARRCKMSTRLFRKHKSALFDMGKFTIENGFIRNQRCAEELAKIWARSDAARIKAAKSHVKRRANAEINSPTSPEKPSNINESEVAGAYANLLTREEEGSKADALDAIASPDDPIPIPLHLVRLPSDKALFGPGLEYLANANGKDPNSYRSLVGKWLKTNGQDHAALWALILEADRQSVANPVEWITAGLKPKSTPHDAATDARREGMAMVLQRRQNQ